mmetsp:Transcript_40445/g.84358  ORF Transcript_40445/g.84358 Transcript_40445/m.84358 type:complete len:124 (+) Transcript_40445:32-403(+)
MRRILTKALDKTFCASMANDGDEGDGHESDVAEGQQYLVHVRNVPKTSSLSDVTALFVRAGFSPPFSFRVSDSIVAVQLDSPAAVEAAITLDGTMLTPPPVGNVKIPGQRVSVVHAQEAEDVL